MIRHSVEEAPEKYVPVLVLIDTEDDFDYSWTVGKYTALGWELEGPYDEYSIIAWYELPDCHKAPTTAHQMTLDEFWEEMRE